ncbi:hypothetical protein DLJ53_19165 [Acuticoccus sediminis]|uniref:Uncharacterized protein n=1 Tax=Acuticoccus sediminis TaxID=2184697 RepID=A0A8B2NVX9_9HYPH|nr:hypothetical protein [Acuticoccus sediminis]RAH99866.1 hypothetical protein DLJ53_19165 [Acuticoccus sediminis]
MNARFECSFCGPAEGMMHFHQIAAAVGVPLADVRREAAYWIVSTDGLCRETHFCDDGDMLRLNRRGIRLMLERLGVAEDDVAEIDRKLDGAERHMAEIHRQEPPTPAAAE